LPTAENELLHKAITSARSGVPKEIIEWQLTHFIKTDKISTSGVQKAAGW
jgi:hypothetical protein